MGDKSITKNLHIPNFLQITNMILPGIVGGITNTYVGHPFDTVKVRMQADGNYRSATDCFYKICKNEGYRGVFKGSISSLYGTIAENSVVFGMNEILKRKFFNSNSKTPISLYHDVLVASASGIVATIVACPFETIKCAMQVDESNGLEKKGKTMYDVYRDYKFRGLYNGFGASCLRNIPYYVCFFPMYSRYINILSNSPFYKNSKNDQHLKDLSMYMLAGGFTGATSWFFIYPLDVIKCNQQLHPEKIGVIDVVSKIHNRGGIRSFYSGSLTTVVRAFPANIALVLGVEYTNYLLGNDKR